MTSFAVQTTLGPVAPLVSKDKGSMGNRIDCAGAQIGNTARTTAQLGVTYGSLAGIGYGMYKSPKFANTMYNGLKKVQNLLHKNEFASKVLSPLEKAMKGLSKNAKVGVALSAIALPVISYITNKHSYKSGQIDQKYTDKAKFQKTL